MLDQITPIILTLDEETNLPRLLGELEWARNIVVVDSGSTDMTQRIAAEHPRVTLLIRPFTTLSEQYQYGLEKGSVFSEWVLQLDADYVPSPELIQELASLRPPHDVNGYQIPFKFGIHGHILSRSFYPPKPILLRRGTFTLYQDGHAERVRLSTGRLENLEGWMIHDDRKTINRFLQGQSRYASEEAAKILSQSKGGAVSRVRRWYLMPLLAPFWLFFVKGLWRDGLPGLHYVLQRVVAEAAIALAIVDAKLRNRQRVRDLS